MREIEFSMNDENSNYEVASDDIENAPTSPHSESKGAKNTKRVKKDE